MKKHIQLSGGQSVDLESTSPDLVLVRSQSSGAAATLSITPEQARTLGEMLIAYSRVALKRQPGSRFASATQTPKHG